MVQERIFYMTSNISLELDFDIVIVGGGLSGLSIACLLGQEGMRVAVVDSADPHAPMTGDERTTAISYGSSKVLEKAGVWNELETRGCMIEDIKIYDGDSSLLLNFLSEEVQDKAFGWIILNSDIRNVLKNRIESLDTVQHIAPANVETFDVKKDYINVSMTNHKPIKTSLVIGADGRRSTVRDFLNIETRQWSYHQSAVICLAEHEHPHHNQAIEHFWPDGPFAVLPMVDGAQGQYRSSVVFTEHKRGGKDSLMDMDQQSFEAALQARFPGSYGKVKIIGKRTAYPLNLVHAEKYTGPRMALIADAAHGIHPIAGQGLNLGFRDVGCLAELLGDAFRNNSDLGSNLLLADYQRTRRFDNMSMVAVTDGLVRLFSNNIPPVRMARRFGLKAVSKLPFAKRFFMKQAMADWGA